MNNEKITGYDEISYTEFIEMLDNDESFVLLIGSADCAHCIAFKPTITKFVKDYQLDVKYIDVSKVSDKEYAILANRTKVKGTPTLVFIEDGVTQTSPKVVGDKSYATLETAFKKAGYIE